MEILYQNSDWLPLRAQNWLEDKLGFWYQESVPLLASAPHLQEFKYWPARIVACRGLIAFGKIDANTIVVILDKRNPWRQMLGRKLYNENIRPLAVICPPVGCEADATSRDQLSVVLENILAGNEYQSFICVTPPHVRNSEPYLGPLNVYMKETDPTLARTWNQARRELADNEARTRFRDDEP